MWLQFGAWCQRQKLLPTWRNSGGHCGEVDGVGSEGHELASTGLDRARLPAWTSVGPFLRSKTVLEKSTTEITNSQPRQKVEKRIEKVGLHCARVGAEAVERQACTPIQLDSCCQRAWTSVRRISSSLLSSEKIELQLFRAGPRNFHTKWKSRKCKHGNRLWSSWHDDNEEPTSARAITG